MLPISKCLVLGVMIATIIVSNLDLKNKKPFDFDNQTYK